MEQQDIELTPRKFLQTLTIMHLTLITGIVIFGIYVYLQQEEWVLNYSDSNDTFLLIVPVVTIGCIVAGGFLYKKQLDKAFSSSGLKQKLTILQTASIIKYALIEGPALLGIVASMTTGNILYLLISTGLVIYLFSLKPTNQKIIQELKLSTELKSQFHRSDEIIH